MPAEKDLSIISDVNLKLFVIIRMNLDKTQLSTLINIPDAVTSQYLVMTLWGPGQNQVLNHCRKFFLESRK